LESPRAKDIDEQIKLWEQELEYLRQLTKQTNIMEVTEKEIQEYREKLKKIQKDLTYYKRKLNEHQTKKSEKQHHYHREMMKEIVKKIEWIEELYKKQEKDEKWFELAQECKLTPLETLMEQKRRLKNLQENQNEIELEQEGEREQPLQYGLCKIEGEADRMRNRNIDT